MAFDIVDTGVVGGMLLAGKLCACLVKLLTAGCITCTPDGIVVESS
jgi:hypothetical protein